MKRIAPNLRRSYIGLVDEWAIYDSSQVPHLLLETGNKPPAAALMEDPAEYQSRAEARAPVKPLDDPDFIGAEAALKRAAAKAIARARRAGLEPVIMPSRDEPPTPKPDATA